MDREHVEDSLMSKRIVGTDEFWDLSLELAGGHEPLNWNLLYSSDFEDEVCSVLMKISQAIDTGEISCCCVTGHTVAPGSSLHQI